MSEQQKARQEGSKLVDFVFSPAGMILLLCGGVVLAYGATELARWLVRGRRGDQPDAPADALPDALADFAASEEDAWDAIVEANAGWSAKVAERNKIGG